jgi:hypothetical protein
MQRFADSSRRKPASDPALDRPVLAVVPSGPLSDTTSAQQVNQADAASRRGLFQALGPLMISKAACCAVIPLLLSCSQAEMPLKQVRVEVLRDGSCRVDRRASPCATVGPDLVRNYPGNEIEISLNNDPQADYASLAAVLGSIRTAGIERTLLVQQQ